MLDWFQKKEASRKYVDLIKEASSKWANWDPPNVLLAGDFGEIDINSGQFEKEGNIYTHPKLASLARDHPPKTHPEEEVYCINSFNTRRAKNEAGAGGGAGGLVNVALSVQVEFEKHRGAFLVMHNPRMHVVPDEFCHATIDNEILRGKKLITQVFQCDGYVLYLSNRQKESISVKLKGGAGASCVSAGVDIGSAWILEGGSGIFRQGYHQTGTFTPLYQIKAIKSPPTRRRATPEPENISGDRWSEIDTPWGILDDDGEEELQEEFSDSE